MWWIVSDNDSAIGTVLKHIVEFDPDGKAKLPVHISKPIFKADPLHCMNIVEKYFYKLKICMFPNQQSVGTYPSVSSVAWGI